MKTTRAQRWTFFLIATVAILGVLAYHTIIKSCCGDDLSPAQLRQLQHEGEAGNVAAMKRLYFYYDEGEEPAKARSWLQKAADHGDGEAEEHLYELLFNSSNVQERKLAVPYLVRAAKHGSPMAQEILGKSYRDGQGVAKDTKSAMFWLREGAESNDPDSILALCDLALQQNDRRQCEACLEMQTKAIDSLRADSNQAEELRRQRASIQRAINR